MSLPSCVDGKHGINNTTPMCGLSATLTSMVLYLEIGVVAPDCSDGMQCLRDHTSDESLDENATRRTSPIREEQEIKVGDEIPISVSKTTSMRLSMQTPVPVVYIDDAANAPQPKPWHQPAR